MSLLNRMYRATILAGALIGTAVSGASAQGFPEKPISLLVGYSPGGGIDLVARVFAEYLSKELGQPVVVENRPGAAGTIAATAVARAEPDGYTALISPSSIVLAEFQKENMPYKLGTDFTPVSMLTTYPYGLAANKAFPPNSLSELVAYTKEHPGAKYASSGVGTAAQLAMEILDKESGSKTAAIPYDSGSDAVVDVLADRLPMVATTYLSVSSYVNSGDMKLIGVFGDKRMKAMPDVESFGDIPELSGYDVSGWHAILLPAGVPVEILQKYDDAIKALSENAEFRGKIEAQQAELTATSSGEAKDYLQRQLDMWGKVLAKGN